MNKQVYPICHNKVLGEDFNFNLRICLKFTINNPRSGAGLYS